MFRRSVTSFAILCSVSLLAACAKPPADRPAVTDTNLVTADGPADSKVIGEGDRRFTVLKEALVRAELARRPDLRADSPGAKQRLARLAEDVPAAPGAASEPAPEGDIDRGNSLVLGFPIGLLGEAQIFGAVITKVSRKEDESLGRLKLIDLTPLHVRPVVVKAQDDRYFLTLAGCAQNCGETTAPARLLDIPIVGVNEAEGILLVDLAVLGEELNLIRMLDPNGEYTKLKTKTSQTVAVDYSLSTLVFDVAVTMVPIAADAPQEEVTFTVRWYLRLESVFHSQFKSRPATPGVGFFMTERSVEPRIHRFSLSPRPGGTPVHYYVKNVPDAFKAPFRKAFDGWNETLKAEVGAPLISYEFVDPSDPRSALLVTGDPRYNIVEWDLDNAAPYGGLGPSIANQFTGEILTANVLVQGPKIVELYTKWFETGTESRALLAAGRREEAHAVVRAFLREVDGRLAAPKRSRFAMSLRGMGLRIPAQMPQYEDPLFARDDFELIPSGEKFDTYMDGYFQELVAHELGHNLGLRHNFRGNLASVTPNQLGKVSSSIMEYLGRGFRHLNRIGAYDRMAIAYGYNGKAPPVLTGYCTDENVAVLGQKGNSPECSRDDATADPFGFFESRLDRAVSLLVNPGEPVASTWTVADLDGPLAAAVGGMGIYAATAQTTGHLWTNFFDHPGRPWFLSGVKSFVRQRIRQRICSPALAGHVAEKATAEDRQKTLDNIRSLRRRVGELLVPAVFPSGELACS